MLSSHELVAAAPRKYPASDHLQTLQHSVGLKVRQQLPTAAALRCCWQAL